MEVNVRDIFKKYSNEVVSSIDFVDMTSNDLFYDFVLTALDLKEIEVIENLELGVLVVSNNVNKHILLTDSGKYYIYDRKDTLVKWLKDNDRDLVELQAKNNEEFYESLKKQFILVIKM